MDAIDGLLFLPGMMCDWRVFAPQIGHFGCYYALSIADLSKDRTIEAMAQRALDAAPSRFVAVGLSMGGIVGFEIWRRAPERVRGLVLMDTNARAEAPPRQAARLDQMAKVRAGGLREVMAEEMKPLYLGASQREDQSILNTVLRMAMELGPDAFERQSIALRDRPDSLACLPEILCPALLLCGAEDRLCPPALHHELVAGLENAKLHIIEGAGHLPTLEAPAAVNCALGAFLSRHFIQTKRRQRHA
ncbi:MAG: alpha/beta fold hydrolase [Sphingomonadales bacterium]